MIPETFDRIIENLQFRMSVRQLAGHDAVVRFLVMRHVAGRERWTTIPRSNKKLFGVVQQAFAPELLGR